MDCMYEGKGKEGKEENGLVSMGIGQRRTVWTADMKHREKEREGDKGR